MRQPSKEGVYIDRGSVRLGNLGYEGLQHDPGGESAERVAAVGLTEWGPWGGHEGGRSGIGIGSGEIGLGGGGESAFVCLARGYERCGSFYQFWREEVEEMGDDE